MAGEFMRIEMLAALHGDCLLVEYGDIRRTRRILIDSGPVGAYAALRGRLERLPKGDRRFELIVLSHVDTDHIEGLIKLFANPRPWPFVVKDVWFNGWRHLEQAHGLLGGRQGEFFSALLARRLDEGCWNGAFKGQAVVVRDADALPEHVLPGGLKLTLLSPTLAKLERMREAWRKDLGDAIDPGDLEAAWALLGQQKKYLPGKGLLGSSAQLDALIEKQSRPDDAAANGSSIAFLAEYAGNAGMAGSGNEMMPGGKSRSCLFLADAHPDAICASVKRLLQARGLARLRVDAVKVAHHGSKANTTDELMSLIESPRFLFSTNGQQFGHPDEEAVGRVIGRSSHPSPTLYFNYLSEHNRVWQERQEQFGYKAVFNDGSGSPMVIAL